jgi:hypothetical protein
VEADIAGGCYVPCQVDLERGDVTDEAITFKALRARLLHRPELSDAVAKRGSTHPSCCTACRSGQAPTGRQYNRRGVSRLPWVYAGGSLALSDEVSRALLRDDLEVIGSTGVKEIDGRFGPLLEDDGPLLLSHGDVLGVFVPRIAECVELSLEFSGDGRDEGVVGVGEVMAIAEESVGFGT